MSLLRYATGVLPLEGYEAEIGKVGAPERRGRRPAGRPQRGHRRADPPVDAIKHQAKTVTVGISRSEDALLRRAAGQGDPRRRGRARHPRLPGPAHPRRRSTRRWPRSLGFTRYRIDWPAGGGPDHRASSTRAASARALPSRTEPRPPAARDQAPGGRRAGGHGGPGAQRRPHGHPGARGQGRARSPGMTLLHVRFHDRLGRGRGQGGADRLPDPLLGPVRRGHRDRAGLRRQRLGDEPIVDLLTEPVYDLAERWRRPTPGERCGSSVSASTPWTSPASPQSWAAGPVCADRLFTDGEQRVCRRAGQPGPVAGGPLRGQGSGDEGARGRPGRLRLGRRRGGPRCPAARPSLVVTGRAAVAGRPTGASAAGTFRSPTPTRWPRPSVAAVGVIPVLTPEEMAAVDRQAAEPVEVLIERAGFAVARRRPPDARRVATGGGWSWWPGRATTAPTGAPRPGSWPLGARRCRWSRPPAGRRAGRGPSRPGHRRRLRHRAQPALLAARPGRGAGAGRRHPVRPVRPDRAQVAGDRAGGGAGGAGR